MTELGLEIYAHIEDVDLLLQRTMLSLEGARLASFLGFVAAPYLHQRISEGFDQEADPAGRKWEPLRYATNRIREEGGFPPAHPINARTGAMRELLTSDHDITAGPTEAQLQIPGDVSGEMLDKLVTAQLGRSDPATKPRPVLGLTPEDIEPIVNELRSFIIEGIAA